MKNEIFEIFRHLLAILVTQKIWKKPSGIPGRITEKIIDVLIMLIVLFAFVLFHLALT